MSEPRSVVLPLQMNDGEEETVSDTADGADRTGQRLDAAVSFKTPANHRRESGPVGTPRRQFKRS